MPFSSGTSFEQPARLDSAKCFRRPARRTFLTSRKETYLSDVAVTNEPRVYDPESSYSFFRDQANAHALGDTGAQRRLMRYLNEVGHEIDASSREGRAALDDYCERIRAGSEARTRGALEREAREQIGRANTIGEFRAATSSTLAGFTTPQWLVSEFAIFRSTQRTFADQCFQIPIPDVGLQINVPRFTANASAGAQTEGSSISAIELDPTGANLAQNVQTISGQIITSQQLLDRTRNMPNGPAFDLIILDQLKSVYDQALNNYALGQAMGQGTTVTGASSFSTSAIASFYADVATAHEQLTDTAGVRLQATHVFTSPDLYMYMSKQLDTQNRPIIQPSLVPGVPPMPVGDEDGNEQARRWTQFTGSCIPGILFWFIDATLPTLTSSVTPIIVARPDKILLFEGDPVVRVFTETIANQLQVVTQLYSYACCVPRYPGATSTINGAAYTTSLK